MSDCSKLNANTEWSKLCYPRICGLLAENPSRLGQAMHNAAFRKAELSFSYSAFASQRTEVALEAMRELGIRGLSLTIPHKERAMSLVDAISPEVQSIGAINTVINTGTTLLGFNTDYIGVQKALQEVKWKAQSSRALVFGAGGAARAALYALRDASCTDITIANRTMKRAENLAAQFSAKAISIEELKTYPADKFDLFINTSAIGMPGAEIAEFPFPLSLFTKDHIVFDMVTSETELLLAAKKSGATTIAGIRMLLHQAVEQNRLFTEHNPDISVMEAALEKEYSK